ncbi:MULTISPECIES: hypothetical protein [Rhodococcus]|uniref:Uncharacterized protein n=1 Tax=Rhodococcus ruber BKS 20-38 TaxID=1278076 RepID=M2XDY9_9NOCA|nr:MULTISPECIES: hypothetical protein [Rhodococcus]EME59266.1 hypothetical protein G352_20287 [Rhodococcus ruber BKS 20-38]
MCYPVTCPNCGKTGWDGCGQHVDAVMRTVPAPERCTCGQDTTPGAQTHTLGGLFRR